MADDYMDKIIREAKIKCYQMGFDSIDEALDYLRSKEEKKDSKMDNKYTPHPKIA